MKEELIKYVMGKADACYSDDFPISNIETWIREFFDQYHRERSKRGDFEKINCVMGSNSSYPTNEKLYQRCGALNSDYK